jgi:hypothetical protein
LAAKRGNHSDIAGKPLSDLIDSLIQCAESGMYASIVKAEQIGKQYRSEKPMVMLEVSKGLL